MSTSEIFFSFLLLNNHTITIHSSSNIRLRVQPAEFSQGFQSEQFKSNPLKWCKAQKSTFFTVFPGWISQLGYHISSFLLLGFKIVTLTANVGHSYLDRTSNFGSILILFIHFGPTSAVKEVNLKFKIWPIQKSYNKTYKT